MNGPHQAISPYAHATSATTTPAAPSIELHLRHYFARVSEGELGALPALSGIVVFGGLFAILQPAFLTAHNLANLLTQAATVSIIAMGLVFVLLLGEIDLSVGYTSGACGAVVAVLLTNMQAPWYAGVAVALLTGLGIGLTLGLLVAKARMPSFIVTLAALLGLQGVVLLMLRGGTNISIHDTTLLQIANGNLDPTVGWLLWGVGLVAYVMIEFRRKRRGLHHRTAAPDPMPLIIWRIAVVTAVSAAIVGILGQERSPHPDTISLKGVPVLLPVTAALVMWWTFVLRRTTYGRRLYELGRNRNAPPAPGVNAVRIRVSAFVICSLMAAVGGIVAVSHAYSVDENTGGINVLLYAIAAAVIGGTSLFGGRGRAVDAVLGGILMAVIDNGMALMELSAGVKYIAICTFLLIAVALDTARHRPKPIVPAYRPLR